MSKESEIKTNVFAKIRAGEISMRSRIYFIARVALLLALVGLAILSAMFFLSFALFSIHQSGQEFLLGFGQRGLLAFFELFPWWSFCTTVAFIFLIDFLLRYFKFGYRLSMLELFLVAFVVVMIAGIGVTFTPLHAILLDTADHNALPVMGPLYEKIHDSHQEQGIYRGTISSIQNTAFVISRDDNDKDTDDGTWTVVSPPGFSTTTLYVGERVYVAGTLMGGVVEAYGVSEFALDSR